MENNHTEAPEAQAPEQQTPEGETTPEVAQSPETAQEAEQGAQISQEEWNQTQRQLQESQREKALSTAIESIKTEFPDFDFKAVEEVIMKMNETDPQKAAMYNSEVGFKLIWRELSEKRAQSDEVNSGASNGSGGGNFDDLLKEAKSGDQNALRNAIAMSK